ncbi:MAG: hypothetical protein HOM47_02780 [Euryarchaeota archaeon]|jgi:predicted CoA-binding protein|nr:hypothetical protein [Euryarchaeota archaeon]MBT5184081.1 hypothetical protein [Euryarchaeota archaeon]
MALNPIPNEELVEMALDYNAVALVGDYTANEKAWIHTIGSLRNANWRFHLVDPDHAGESFNELPILGSVEEIRNYVPLIQIMDTTQKEKWFELASQRMEVWGDIQMIWMHKNNAITQRDRDDAHAYGWSVIENECLAKKLSEKSPSAP